jgi:uncharacterized membrane protein
MSWEKRFRLRQYVRSSLWLLPLLGAILGVVLGEADVSADQSVTLPAALTYSSTTATTVLSAIVGATAALTGFVVTVTVLVVNIATGLFSARYLRLWYRDRMLKAALALLITTLAFAFALLRRVDTGFVPNLGVTAAGVLVIASVVTFLVFLDRCIHRLRPVAVVALVAGYVYRGLERDEALFAAENDIFSGAIEPSVGRPSLLVHSHTAGAIQAIDYRGLVSWARANRSLVAVTHTIGDWVPTGARLIEVYGGPGADDAAERRLEGMIAFGRERTIDQDPSFGIRIIVDIADHALSAAVNDPTTAVQAIDHLGEVLRLVGGIDFSTSEWSGDPTVRTGLVIRIRSWEDYLALAVTEIREYGSTSITVMRRMRAMLEELREEVRPEHQPAVEDELARLEAAVLRAFGDSTDLDRASTADPQGIGGRTSRPGLSQKS